MTRTARNDSPLTEMTLPFFGGEKHVLSFKGVPVEERLTFHEDRDQNRVINYVQGVKIAETMLDGLVTVHYDAQGNTVSEDFRTDVASPVALRIRYQDLQDDGFVQIDGMNADGKTACSALYRNFSHCKLSVCDKNGDAQAYVFLQDHAIAFTYLEESVLGRKDFTLYDAQDKEIAFDEPSEVMELFGQFRQAWNDVIQPVAIQAKGMSNVHKDAHRSAQERDAFRVTGYKSVVATLQNKR